MSEKEIKDAVAEAVDAAKTKAKSGAGPSGKSQSRKSAKRFPFKVDGNGVSRQIKTENDTGSTTTKWVRFGSELRVLALTRDNDGENWGRLLEVVDRDGVRHIWAMPAAMLAGSGDPLRGELFRLGFELDPRRDAKAWILEYLITSEPEKRARCVSCIGWHGRNFVLPDGPIGPDDSGEQVILQTAEKPDHAFNIAGILEDWQTHVAGPAQGNSRLVLAIATGLAAPLLALTGDEGGGFHFRGASSSGKSTALEVAGSVWGGCATRGYKRNWRATDNALESVAAMSNDSLLCLDEISQIDPKAAGASAYMLANGKGKARAGREGQARRVQEWRVLFLSNGEIGLKDKIMEGGGRIAAGMEVRIIDLRADAGAGMGLFENIHGVADPASFAQSIKKAANTYYGTPARAFLAELAKDMAGFRDKIAELRTMFMGMVLPSGADGQVQRVADRFALVAAAGELATAMGITGWPAGEVRDAAQRCFQDWLQERGGIGSSEVAEAKRRISEALQIHGQSRFQKWANSSSDRMVILNRLGFVRVEGETEIEEVESTFFFQTAAFKELLAGLDFKTIVSELMQNGVIVEQAGQPTKNCYVPSGNPKRNRLYQIDDSKLDDIAGKSDA